METTALMTVAPVRKEEVLDGLNLLQFLRRHCWSVARFFAGSVLLWCGSSHGIAVT
jgi:hypothetical protein